MPTAWERLRSVFQRALRLKKRSRSRGQDEARVSPIGYFTNAEAFAHAAFVVREKRSQKTGLVDYYLMSHAIELALKAFLRAKGASIDYLRDDIRHSLERALNQSEKRGMQVNLTKNDRALLRLLNASYSSKGLEYFERGSRPLPRFDALIGIAERVFGAVLPACLTELRNRT